MDKELTRLAKTELDEWTRTYTRIRNYITYKGTMPTDVDLVEWFNKQKTNISQGTLNQNAVIGMNMRFKKYRSG